MFLENSRGDKIMIKSDVCNIKNYEDTKVIDLKPKLGRNDLCHCGSGKKYKKCCAKKDEEEELIRNRIEQIETISDKYFAVKEYIELSGYPLRKFDFFLIEILNIAGSILYKYNKTNKDKSKEIIKTLYNYSKDFYSKCINREYNYLKTPEKNISFKDLIDKGLDITALPEELQKQTSLNFFYIEFINRFSFKLEEELGKEIDKDIANNMVATTYWLIMDSIVDNCIGDCGNECLVGHEENAYCDFCSFASEDLPCPKKGNISYEAIKESEKDMIH
jgi:hypothetical protein